MGGCSGSITRPAGAEASSSSSSLSGFPSVSQMNLLLVSDSIDDDNDKEGLITSVSSLEQDKRVLETDGPSFTNCLNFLLLFKTL